MLRLSTLGGVALEDEHGPLSGPLIQHRRLALLARLAAAGERGVSRDSLAALLWPESDEERARHTLRQWLSLLRRDLEAEKLLLGTAELRLNPQVITSDVGELRDALGRGDLEPVATLYAGPFLDGFHVSDAPEFERWAESERDTLAREAGRALQTLAETAAAAGDSRRAAQWWRRLVAMNPLGSHAVVGLMTTLADAGERAAALEVARVHESLLRSELDLAPDARVTALAHELRATHASRQPITTPNVTDSSRGGAGMVQQRLAESVQAAVGGAYRILRVVERSAFATHYFTRDTRGAECVLRVLAPGVAAALSADRFVAELRRAAAVRHPALAPLLDVGVREGFIYLVTPVVRGETLRDRLTRDQQIGLAEGLSICERLADALAVAHASDVPHLDVKPRHVVLSEHGALLGDLGLAAAAAFATTDISTRSGITIGTPAYMSPEQAGGAGTADARSDVYALGCILYHMLGGESPFAGGTAQATLVRRLTETPAPLRTIRSGVPPRLEALVLRMLERVPGDRPTMAHVRDELRIVIES
jgi:serine/threonine-protein kinase